MNKVEEGANKGAWLLFFFFTSFKVAFLALAFKRRSLLYHRVEIREVAYEEWAILLHVLWDILAFSINTPLRTNHFSSLHLSVSSLLVCVRSDCFTMCNNDIAQLWYAYSCIDC